MPKKPKVLAKEQEIKVEYPINTKVGVYHTFDGHKITAKEEKFIQYIIEGETQRGAYMKAFKTDNVKKAEISSTELMKKQKIAGEIKHRLDLAKNKSIATATEIMEYFTRVMRGDEKDQFGLDAPLGERTSAAKELMKRMVELEEKATAKATPEIKITLNFDRDGEEK